jgi:hypothetical protein
VTIHVYFSINTKETRGVKVKAMAKLTLNQFAHAIDGKATIVQESGNAKRTLR